MQNIFPRKQEQEDFIFQIEQLKKSIAELQTQGKKQEVHYHFQIEQIQVEHLNLEQLLFRLEKMHTEHLNGTLNFGNNFCGSSHQTKGIKPPKPQKESIDPPKQPTRVNVRGRRREEN